MMVASILMSMNARRSSDKATSQGHLVRVFKECLLERLDRHFLVGCERRRPFLERQCFLPAIH